MGEDSEEFPVGMRVLAVDDDATCLMFLGSILRKCKYHVTTTSQAIEALKMLRENKNKFDLIITDVRMPDMDGFKLLELVVLEMDIPVIMLSGDEDAKTVMKGITNGACDYLLKPARIEEIQNIWQHVYRKKQSVSEEHNLSDNRKIRRKKDRDVEEEGDNEEDANEKENYTTKKKPRIVWSVDLHQRFMSVVNHLGIDKAVPRKILDLMNVPGITRENVASHLQKFRLYRKKVASQEANPVPPFSLRTSYLPLTAVDSLGNFHSFAPPTQPQALPSFQHFGVPGRKDSTIWKHNSHGIFQIGCNNLSKLQHENLIQSDQLQQQRRTINEVNNRYPAGVPGTSGSNNSMVTVTNDPQFQAREISSGLPSVCSRPFEVNAGVSSNLPDVLRCSETWQSSITSTSGSNILPTNSGVSSVVSQINCNPVNFSSSSTPAASQCHPGIGNMMLMLKGTNEDSNYLKFGNVGNTQQQSTHEPNIVSSSPLNPPLTDQSTVDPTSYSQRLNNGTFSKRVFMDMNEQTNYGNLFLTQQCQNDESMSDGQLKYKDDYLLEDSTLQEGLNSNGCNFDELVNIINSVQEDAMFIDS